LAVTPFFRRRDRGKFPAPLWDDDLGQRRFDRRDLLRTRLCGRASFVKANSAQVRRSVQVRFHSSLARLNADLFHVEVAPPTHAVIATRAIVIRDQRVSVSGANFGLAFIRKPTLTTDLPRRIAVRRLSDEERMEVLTILRSPRFVDRLPGQVVAVLLDEGRYACSESTMYRLCANTVKYTNVVVKQSIPNITSRNYWLRDPVNAGRGTLPSFAVPTAASGLLSW
jgi:hypothetical protein